MRMLIGSCSLIRSIVRNKDKQRSKGSSMIHRGVSSHHTVSVGASMWGSVAVRLLHRGRQRLMGSLCVQGSASRPTAHIMYDFIHNVQPALPWRTPRRRDAMTLGGGQVSLHALILGGNTRITGARDRCESSTIENLEMLPPIRDQPGPPEEAEGE